MRGATRVAPTKRQLHLRSNQRTTRDSFPPFKEKTPTPSPAVQMQGGREMDGGEFYQMNSFGWIFWIIPL